MSLTQYIKEYAAEHGVEFDECEANGVETSKHLAERVWCACIDDRTVYLAQLYDTEHPGDLTQDRLPEDADLVKEYMRVDNSHGTHFMLTWEQDHPDYILELLGKEKKIISPSGAIKHAKIAAQLFMSGYEAGK